VAPGQLQVLFDRVRLQRGVGTEQQHDFALFDRPDGFGAVARRDFARVVGHPARDAGLSQTLGDLERVAQVLRGVTDDHFDGLRFDANDGRKSRGPPVNSRRDDFSRG